MTEFENKALALLEDIKKTLRSIESDVGVVVADWLETRDAAKSGKT